MGLKLYTIFIYNVSFLKVRFGGQKWGGGVGVEESAVTKERKGGEEKKSNGCALSFYNGYLEKTLGRKRSIWLQRFQKSGYLSTNICLQLIDYVKLTIKTCY